ncbi:MAG: hypothetical protein QXM27_02785 [Candidatus Pacearchaeota archaeon]
MEEKEKIIKEFNRLPYLECFDCALYHCFLDDELYKNNIENAKKVLEMLKSHIQKVHNIQI